MRKCITNYVGYGGRGGRNAGAAHGAEQIARCAGRSKLGDETRQVQAHKLQLSNRLVRILHHVFVAAVGEDGEIGSSAVQSLRKTYCQQGGVVANNYVIILLYYYIILLYYYIIILLYYCMII
jgi:hypothetical protein